MIDTLQEQEREQLVKFLKESSILHVIDDRIIYGLSLSLEEISCGPGFVVFKEGDPSDGLYIVKKGAVEVSRGDSDAPIAYLTAGECFGEMALINSSPRNATCRVPEQAVVLKLSERASADMQKKFPALAKELSSLARRRDAGKLPFTAPGLQGNTAFFDLPTVIQAVAASRQSGHLNIFATTNKPSAKLTFIRGKVTSAHFKHLHGEVAIYELLSSNDPADFVFERKSEKEMESEQSNLNDLRPLDNLLIEGSRRQDEFAKLLDATGGLNMSFSTATISPKWASLSNDARELGHKIWNLIELDITVEEIFPLIKADRYTVLKTLNEMLHEKMITKVAALLPENNARADEPRKMSTKEIDLKMLFKRSAKLASTLYALNMVASNLSIILDQTIVKDCLEEALKETSKEFEQLATLKVHHGGKTVDVRGAGPELSKRPDSLAAIQNLTRKFLQLIGKKCNHS